jgi:PAS domain S-box-containing protein
MGIEQIDTENNYVEDNYLDKINELSLAIELFNGAADKVGNYYQSLEKKVSELDLELKEKNIKLKNNLKEKEEVKKYLNNILESITTGVIVLDLQKKIKTINKAAKLITGFNNKKIIGKTFDYIFNKENITNLPYNFNALISSNGNIEFEIEIRATSETIIYAGINISSLYNINKKKIGTVITLQDITNLKKLEEQANRTDRLSAMGEIAVKIAHEIRNPLGSIELFAGVLKKDLGQFDNMRSLIGHISTGVSSIDNIVSNLLLFVKPDQQPYFKKVNINDSLKESLLFSHHLVSTDKSIKLKIDYTDQSLIVDGDTELLKQVWLNIILNSVQAMPEGGEISIFTRKAYDLKKNIESAEIKICDTGLGIKKNDLTRIFDPFFSSKRSGTGLGLTIVHNIINDHRGSIHITCLNPGVACLVRIPLSTK